MCWMWAPVPALIVRYLPIVSIVRMILVRNREQWGSIPQLDYESDILTIPVPDGSFDVVLCTEVLEHVPEPILAVKEMARILSGEGRLLLTAPLGSFLHQEPYHFYGGYTPYWYRQFLPEAGLRIASIEANRGFFSWFGQEASRFSALIDPRRSLRTGWRWPLLALIWLITLPFCRSAFPPAGGRAGQIGLGADSYSWLSCRSSAAVTMPRRLLSCPLVLMLLGLTLL